MSEHVNGGALNDEQRDALKTEHWRWCVAAPPGSEKHIGTRFQKVGDKPGTPRWHAEDHSIEVMVDSPGEWVFSKDPPVGVLDERAIAAELTAAELAAGIDTTVLQRRAREVYDHHSFVADLDAAVKEIRDLLVQKNQAYGNSALDPVRIFSKADPMEQLFVRIDDKLSRLKRGHAAGEDVVKDLQGYLLLVRVAQMRAEKSKT